MSGVVIAVIVIASIMAWFGFGLVISQPALSQIYQAALANKRKYSYSWERLDKEQAHDSIMRWVYLWYTVLALFWPFSIFYVLTVRFASRYTPEHVNKVNEQRAKEAEAELKEAQKIIAEFSPRRK